MVFHGTGEKRWEQEVDPRLECGENAPVRMTSTTICGMVLGHKTAGIVEGVGSAGSKL